MECAAKGSGRRCLGSANRRCGGCGVVFYCSVSHQILQWSVHKEECARLKQQMCHVDLINDFPFAFSQAATYLVCEKAETRCSFLDKLGIHRVGMWVFECSCGASVNSLDPLRSFKSWNLSSKLCPCREPLSELPKQLSSWKAYYEWRGILLDSPVALLLHWPLTVYQAVKLALEKQLIPEITDQLCIHYLGPERELYQLAVFGEFRALFPGVQVHIEFIGPAIPQDRDGEKINLYSYAYCEDSNCSCKSVNSKFDSATITVKLHSGVYSGFNSCSKCWNCCLQKLVTDHSRQTKIFCHFSLHRRLHLSPPPAKLPTKMGGCGAGVGYGHRFEVLLIGDRFKRQFGSELFQFRF